MTIIILFLAVAAIIIVAIYVWLRERGYFLKNQAYGSQVVKTKIYHSSGEFEVIGEKTRQTYQVTPSETAYESRPPGRPKIVSQEPKNHEAAFIPVGEPIELHRNQDKIPTDSGAARSTFTGMRNPDLKKGDRRKATETITALPAFILKTKDE